MSYRKGYMGYIGDSVCLMDVDSDEAIVFDNIGVSDGDVISAKSVMFECNSVVEVVLMSILGMEYRKGVQDRCELYLGGDVLEIKANYLDVFTSVRKFVRSINGNLYRVRRGIEGIWQVIFVLDKNTDLNTLKRKLSSMYGDSWKS